MAENKEFDLNIEKILEDWEIFHAIREIIANAIDEQILTQTKDIDIFPTADGCWHIADYGRGLSYHHLTQKENDEKLNNDKMIGRFGIGLKDALATLYRHSVKVKISSKYGVITLKQAFKAGFDDIVTLHADIVEPDDRNMAGTDFCLEGCTEDDIRKAKSLFLKFSDAKILESTGYGDIITKEGRNADIYINGVKVAEEPNFLFSYNITSLNAKIKKALNRERTNIGRTAYTDRVKAILSECRNEKVIKELIEDLQRFQAGTGHDEMGWQEVQLHASEMLRKTEPKTTFITPEELKESPSIIDEMERKGYIPVIVSKKLSDKMEVYNKGAEEGETFTTVKQFIVDERKKFKPEIINIEELNDDERAIYDKTDAILKYIGGKPPMVNEILIIPKIYEFEGTFNAVGLWKPDEKKIFVKRSQLKSLSGYAGTLLHECAHALSGEGDVNRDFETELTSIIGQLASELLEHQ